MAQDLISRLTERAGEHLEDGEYFLGAQPMTIKGRVAFTAWAADADLAGELPNYVTQHGSVDELSVADEALPNAFLTAVTDKRVFVFGRSITGKPKELVDTHDLAATTLDVVDTGGRARSRVFVFGTPSGKVFAGECGINGKALQAADAFVDAWLTAESN